MLFSKWLRNFTDKKYCFFVLLILATTPLPMSLCYAEQSETYEKSVVMILAVNQEYDYATPWKKGPMGRGSGSGFIIEGNRILTNAHNVANLRYLEVKKQNLAKRYPAKVQFVGHDCDLALVTVDDPEFFVDTEPLAFGTLPQINSTVQTCGFPMGGRQISITEGVVSRLETNVYSHSQASQHLVVQTDAAINPGNSGGPVLQDGKVVGVAFQGLTVADNIGFMIPTTVISHFLKDIEDGKYDGFSRLGISLFHGLHNPFYKNHLKIPDSEDGIVITDVRINSTAYGILQTSDVLTKIDDFNVDNDGRVQIYDLSLDLTETLDRKQIGETVTITFYRDGQKTQQDFIIGPNEQVLPWNRQYDTKPDYRVYAGLTFVQLNRNFLERWGNSWVTDIPFPLRYLFFDSNQLNKDPDRKEYVVLSEILPDEVNAYLGGYKNQAVESVNGISINELADLDEAFKKDEDGFCIVKFINNDAPMVIDAETAKMNNGFILQKYQVPVETPENENGFLF
ncbi:MAG: S1C family serine protease [Planctomycetota bacterium]|jgi:S1-C subfamily serine protease